MARARNIKASFFQNPELGDLEPLERLCFIGMWTIADYRGCIEFKAKRMKIQLLPYDECCIEKIVINLEQAGLIRTYSVQGQPYIKVINFVKHQNPHKNERDSGSNIPDIESDDHSFEENRSEYRGLGKIRNNRDKARINRNEDGSPRADSLFLIPDSGTLIPEVSQQVAHVAPSATHRLKATRLPNDWKPMQEHWDAAILINSDLGPRLNLIAETFRDYWIAKSGKDATKMDWMATWKNWIRREAQNAKGGTGTTGKKSYGEQRAELFDGLTDYAKATNF